MLNIIYYINGVSIKSPANHKELSLELNFDEDSPDCRLTTNKWRFVNENAKIINDYIAAGLTGSYGIFQGLPFDIVLQDGTSTETFKLYLDLTDEATFSSYEVNCIAKEYSKIQWLNDIADSFSFEYLHEETSYLPSSNFVAIPYVINTVPNYREVFLVIFAVTYIANQLYHEASYISEKLGEAGNPFQAVGSAIALSIHILYLITLLIALVKLINDIIDLIVQPVKYHKGMYAKDLIQCACDYLQLDFESTILKGITFNKLYILPEKLENPPDQDDERILGFLSPNADQKGYYNGTFGQLLRDLKSMFNAKIIIQNEVLKFERIDYNNSVESYTIPDIRQDFYSFNSDEINSNYLIEFRTDVNDRNTIQEYTGTIFQAIIQPLTVSNIKLKLMKGLKQVIIPFALGKRKEDLTLPEQLLDTFLTAIGAVLNVLIIAANAVIDLVNAIGKIIKVLSNILDFFGVDNNLEAPSIEPIPSVDFGSIINDRIGMLLLENDSVIVPKILMVEQGSIDRNTKLTSDHATVLSARYLYENFHYINSFAPYTGNPKGNQWKRIRIDKVPFTLSDFLKVKNNNRVFDSYGNTAKIENLQWNPWTQLATIEYRINYKYTNNLTVITNEGQGF